MDTSTQRRLKLRSVIHVVGLSQTDLSVVSVLTAAKMLEVMSVTRVVGDTLNLV